MPRVRPPGKIDPHVLPTVMKSRDILMHMQQNINVMAINLPRYPRFHKAIKVSNIALLSFPLRIICQYVDIPVHIMCFPALQIMGAENGLNVGGALFRAGQCKDGAFLPMISFKGNSPAQTRNM